MMITMFDIEILADKKAFKMNPAFYGFGSSAQSGRCRSGSENVGLVFDGPV